MRAGQWNAFGFMCSFLIPLFIVALLSEKSTLSTFIVLGQGHFLLTYLYQWRGGKIGWKYLTLYTLACVGLLAGFSFVPEPQLWTMVAAGSIFAIHFFVDEMHINGVLLTRETKLLGAAFVLMYSVLLVRYAYDITAPLATALIVCAACAPLIVSRFRARTIAAAEMFFLTGIGVLLVMLLAPVSIGLIPALSFIILFHYLRWYLFFLFKFNAETDRTRLWMYVRDVAVVNAFMLAAFLAYSFVPMASALRFFFVPEYFFAWTILHVLFSIRVPKRAVSASAAHASIH